MCQSSNVSICRANKKNVRVSHLISDEWVSINEDKNIINKMMWQKIPIFLYLLWQYIAQVSNSFSTMVVYACLCTCEQSIFYISMMNYDIQPPSIPSVLAMYFGRISIRMKVQGGKYSSLRQNTHGCAQHTYSRVSGACPPGNLNFECSERPR